MYSAKQRNVIQSLVGTVTGYFDATGGHVGMSHYTQIKRILYYSIVINASGENVPIFEMITENHDVVAILNYLMILGAIV